MALDSDIRDQAYQFFIQEAPELLQVIESELLTLKTERTTAKVHSLMRAAHSIKGGSACVGLETIKTIAHRLEDIFKALHNKELEIDAELESLLLQAYDCLRLPLMDQILAGHFNAEQAIAIAEPVFAKIEAQLGDFLTGEEVLPNAVELGIDITLSIFEVDVAQELERLTNVLAHPESNQVAGELRALADVFTGIAELLSLPGFGAIAQTTLAALDAHPEQALQIAKLALSDFLAAREGVLAGDRLLGGSPSPALTKLAAASPVQTSSVAAVTVIQLASELELLTLTEDEEESAPSFSFSSIEDIFGSSVLSSEINEDFLDVSALFTSEEIPETELGIPGETLTSIADFDEILDFSDSSLSTQNQLPLSTVDEPDHLILTTDEEILEQKLSEREQKQTSDKIFKDSNLIPEIPEVPNNYSFDGLKLPALPAANKNQEFELIAQEEILASPPSLDEVFGSFVSNLPTIEIENLSSFEVAEPTVLIEERSELEPNIEETDLVTLPTIELTPVSPPAPELHSELIETQSPANIQEIVQKIEQLFDSLPSVTELPVNLANTENSPQLIQTEIDKLASKTSKPAKLPAAKDKQKETITPTNPTPQLSVRVDLDRLERMNNLVGELAINRNGLFLQNEQLQATVKELLRRFTKFQEIANHLRDLSDQMIVAPERHSIASDQQTFAPLKPGNSGVKTRFTASETGENIEPNSLSSSTSTPLISSFDSLEMDSYGELHSMVQESLEEMVQLEEIVGDVAHLAGQSSQTLEGQRQMIAHLRDDLMWARMLPLREVLSRFPRVLRDLSTKYKKPVDLKLSGTGVLVDKAALEKLNDPLLHLLRNAFDHGIEPPEVRRQRGKPERGQIEIQAYHQGSHTIIEVRDDGQGANLERIRLKALELGLLSPEQVAITSTTRLLDLLFEPGFSTAAQVSELSGRGVGLDVARSQLRSLKGTITITTTPGKGTTFTLRIPLTLTIAKLLVCLVGSTAYAFPADSIEEIVIPKTDQMKHSGKQRFLHWRKRIVPVYHLSELLDYSCPLPESIPSQALVAVPTPEAWAPPMLLIRRDNQIFALEIDRLVTEQELVIKPFGAAIAPPSYIYGCTILGDGSLIPVIDGATLLTQMVGQSKNAIATTTFTDLPTASPITTASIDKTKVFANPAKSPLILIVDDSITLRQTLALTLQKAGYRVLQARDGREAIEQLQQNSSIQMVVCDVEMPNLNGFEFLNHRRQDPQLSKIPVAMLTSRSSEKHRQLATHLGASAYFSKPYLEQEFLAALKALFEKSGALGAVVRSS
ncbi:response regulator [Coleofasciculus sp. FACHB-1120]|uniref:hybrid sensor histidine kinase/response regulator n=1 Tax=Coleofasciculus sp. FACHB-1120 TaxID=2692783 RepID=UPI0016836556|nr:response regulator [Coleofasciculus sp. FACHB-1120]MBD2742667.1 chemotaxis protein CheW [Coleofasciculus sp. FACHB-1120]